jgi:hypothetical protein
MADDKDPPINWRRVARQVDEVHHAVFGNGEPEKSLLSRVSWNERRVKEIIAVGITIITGALFVLLKGAI